MHRKTALFLLLFLACSSLASWPQTEPNAQPLPDLLAVRPEKYAIGQVPPEQRMERMVLVLQANPDQETAIEELIQAQQDPSSSYHHQWLTPQAFGKRFGISINHLQQVATWLQIHGMEIEEIPTSRRTVVFSGTAPQVESTFHTLDATIFRRRRTSLRQCERPFDSPSAGRSGSRMDVAERGRPACPTGVNGFKSSVSLSMSGLPNGVTASFVPASIASPGTGSSTLTLTASPNAAAGKSNPTVTATAAGLTKTQALDLTVTH
jgi:Pro-kumamolisin, activation domain